MVKNVFSGILRYGWIPVIIALVIFYLCCLIPVDDIPEVEVDFGIPFDKLAHFFMYMGLSGATALYYIYDRKGNINIFAFIIGVIILPILYGGLIEIVQSMYFYPREGDWFDFLADSLGVLASLPFAYYLRKWLLLKN